MSQFRAPCLSLFAILAACVNTPDSRRNSATLTCPDQPDAHCVIGETGIAIASSQGRADVYIEAIDAGAVAFEEHFERTAPTVALIEGNDLFATLEDDISARNAGIILSPWVTSVDKNRAIEASILRQLEVQKPDLPEDAMQGLIDKALAATPVNLLSGEEEKGAIAHEFCHLRLVRSFHFDVSDTTGASKHYGGDAPDWLDETAAVLCENAELTAKRHRHLGDIITGESDDELWPIAEFVTMDHPLAEAERGLVARLRQEHIEEAERGGPSTRIITLVGEEAERFKAQSADGNPAVFYWQSRGFADYLIARTGDPAIFGSIASAYSNGSDFVAWLSAEGTALGLPRDLDSLDADWTRWLCGEYATNTQCAL